MMINVFGGGGGLRPLVLYFGGGGGGKKGSVLSPFARPKLNVNLNRKSNNTLNFETFASLHVL